jgi:hypothetical protein
MEPEGSLPYQQEAAIPRHCVEFRNELVFRSEELLAPRPIPLAGGPT